MKPMKYKELVRLLKAKGYEFDHQTGSHGLWKNVTTNAILSIPYSKEIASGTIRNILKLLGGNGHGNCRKVG